jgi:hypothetical protein
LQEDCHLTTGEGWSLAKELSSPKQKLWPFEPRPGWAVYSQSQVRELGSRCWEGCEVVVFRPLLLALRDGLETQFWLLSEVQEQAVQAEQQEGRRRLKSLQSE